MTEIDVRPWQAPALRDERGKAIRLPEGYDLSSGNNNRGERLYNLGLSERDMDLLVMLIDDEATSDKDEEDIRGLRRRLVAKRAKLRKLIRDAQ